MAKHKCDICGYVYDDGWDGVPFDQLPNNWTCPGCGVGKEDFTEV